MIMTPVRVSRTWPSLQIASLKEEHRIGGHRYTMDPFIRGQGEGSAGVVNAESGQLLRFLSGFGHRSGNNNTDVSRWLVTLRA